jgi:hypothetical protein
MFDLIVGLGESFIKHGVSLSFIGAALFVVLKQRPSKRWIRRHFPRLLQDDADVINYEARQIRIENDVRAIKAHLGVKECVERNDLSQSMGKHSLKSSTKGKLFAPIVSVFTATGLTTYSKRRNKRMKQLLIKWGSRKFQAFLLVTITNMIVFIGFLMGVGDIEERVTEWTPLINVGLQFLAGTVYMMVEGKVDTATAQSKTTVQYGDSGPAE